LRSFETPTLEDIEQRRFQLWVLTLSLLLAVAVAAVLIAVFAFMLARMGVLS